MLMSAEFREMWVHPLSLNILFGFKRCRRQDGGIWSRKLRVWAFACKREITGEPLNSRSGILAPNWCEITGVDCTILSSLESNMDMMMSDDDQYTIVSFLESNMKLWPEKHHLISFYMWLVLLFEENISSFRLSTFFLSINEIEFLNLIFLESIIRAYRHLANPFSIFSCF